MNKEQEQINEIISLIGRVENPTLRRKFDNIFDIFEATGKITLSEGVLKSYDAGAIINSLQKKFNLTTNRKAFNVSNNFDGYIQIDYARDSAKHEKINEEIVILEIVLRKEYTERVERFLTACGWYMSYCEDFSKKGYSLSIFEKRFQTTEGVLANSEKYLYHLAPISRLPKIMKIGLCPKSGCKLGFHPDRVYLFSNELSTMELYHWKSQLSATERKETVKNGYALLKINTEGLNIAFYADPNLDGAVYTRENIPPSAISIEREF